MRARSFRGGSRSRRAVRLFESGFLAAGLRASNSKPTLLPSSLRKAEKGLPFRDEARDEIGLSGFNKLQYLFARHFALTNGFSHPEFAFRRVAALIGISCIVDCAGLADGTRSDRRKSGKIDRRSVRIRIFAKVEACLNSPSILIAMNAAKLARNPSSGPTLPFRGGFEPHHARALCRPCFSR